MMPLSPRSESEGRYHRHDVGAKQESNDDSLFWVVVVWLLVWTVGVVIVLYVTGVFGYGKHDHRSDVAGLAAFWTLIWAGMLALAIWGSVAFHRARPKRKKDQS